MIEMLHKWTREGAASLDRMKVDEHIRGLRPQLHQMLNEGDGSAKEAVQQALDLLSVLEQKTNFTKEDLQAVNRVLQSAGVSEAQWFEVN